MDREEYIGILETENAELKKQLRETQNCLKDMFHINIENDEKLNKLKKRVKPDYYTKGLEGTLNEYQQVMNNYSTQQTKFIKYLEDLIKQNETVFEVSKYALPKNCSKLLIDFYKEILQKYKEIIGDRE